MLGHHSGWAVTLKRKCTSDHFIEDNPKGVDITALTASKTSHLFGCNVERRSKLNSRECSSGRFQEPCKTKVGENGFAHGIARRVLLVEQNIGGFEVAMNHALLMSVVDGKADRRKELHNLRRRWHVSHA